MLMAIYDYVYNIGQGGARTKADLWSQTNLSLNPGSVVH